MAKNLNAASFSVLMVILVDLILCIVSLATNYWSDLEISIGSIQTTMHRGLVKFCIDDKGCFNYEDGHVPGYIRGALAGMSLALIANVIAFITMFLWTFGDGPKSTMRLLKFGTMIILAIAVFWYIVALAVFADNDKEKGGYINRTTDFTLSWSWGIAMIAGLVDILGAVLIIFVERID